MHRLEQFDDFYQKLLLVNMKNMDFMPPIVPSLVFARTIFVVKEARKDIGTY